MNYTQRRNTMVMYMAHPVGHGEQRAANIARAKRWLKALVQDNDRIAVVASWLPYVENLDETSRDRGLRDDLMVLSRCDGIILCGGELSPGMSTELELAKALGLLVIDLLDLGPEPPEKKVAEQEQLTLPGVE